MTDPEDPEGYSTPYAKFLEEQLDEVEKILRLLVLEHGEHKSVDHLIAEIEQWMGDDWFYVLSEEDQKRLDAIKGWTYG